MALPLRVRKVCVPLSDTSHFQPISAAAFLALVSVMLANMLYRITFDRSWIAVAPPVAASTIEVGFRYNIYFYNLP